VLGRQDAALGGHMNRRTYPIGHSTLTLEFGDLTTSAADVLVSSDDAYLTMGGGVSAAILRAAGESILRDAAKKVPAQLGDVVVTTAGALPAKHVFHVITIGDGPLTPHEVVAQSTRRCLELLRTLGLRSIAFPAIGAGVAGFAYEDVAIHMADVIVDCLKQGSAQPIDVTIYLYDRFRRMQPIDFVDFFEHFAVRTSGLGPPLKPSPGRGAATRQRPSQQRRRASKQEKRRRLIEKLSALDREREQLEGQLAEYKGVLTKKEVTRVEKRLHEVQQERVGVLSEVRAPLSPQRVAVFVSYAHADEKLRRELGKHLRVLEDQGLIATWHDRMIGAGVEWAGAIDTRLEQSHVILLLVSADFMDSQYIRDVEMKRALERHEKREALVIPVILRPVLLKGTPFAKIQALPKDARALTEWPSVDAGCVDVTEGLRDAILALSSSTVQP
jgi:O-acetyl-ADP-ribose deacetylase (regulator of RNase III)